jgi:hypothetical protein
MQLFFSHQPFRFVPEGPAGIRTPDGLVLKHMDLCPRTTSSMVSFSQLCSIGYACKAGAAYHTFEMP